MRVSSLVEGRDRRVAVMVVSVACAGLERRSRVRGMHSRQRTMIPPTFR